jgi:predicted HTH transcriptional regulator
MRTSFDSSSTTARTYSSSASAAVRPSRLRRNRCLIREHLGGWILLGVDDDKTLHGYEIPERTDLQSHLGALLREQCDPLPPFVAERCEIDNKKLVVVRVFESTDAPHIVRGKGAVYLRSSKGKGRR